MLVCFIVAKKARNEIQQRQSEPPAWSDDLGRVITSDESLHFEGLQAVDVLEPGERRSRSLVECAGSMIETALPPIRKMMERAASSRSTRPRNSKSAEASNLAGMPFVEGPERILSHVHEEPPSPGHRRRPVLGELPVEVVSGAEEVTRLARRAPPPSRLLAEFREAGERCRQFRQHSE